MNATYNGIAANHIAYSQDLVIKSGRVANPSAVAWNYMQRCGADMIDTALNYDNKYNKAAKYAGSRRKAYWATFSKIAKAVWAWAKDMRKAAETVIAMAKAKVVVEKKAAAEKKESKALPALKSWEMVVNLDSALYVINRSAYDSLMDAMMRDADDIGDTPFGNLYEVDYDEIATCSYLSSLPVKSNPFGYVAAEWARY